MAKKRTRVQTKKQRPTEVKRSDFSSPPVDEDSTARPEGYEFFLEMLKEKIRLSQIDAAVAVNVRLIGLYYSIGAAIVEQQERAGWGDAVIDRLSKDLSASFSDMKGFSQRNLYRMRAFYLAYRNDSGIFATAVAKIPWGHNSVILDKVKDPEERAWYAAMTLESGWSRAVLQLQIESSLYHRQGKAITNFSRTLPVPLSDVAHQLLKDPYNFDFLSLSQESAEREIEKSLLQHIREFLLELGIGFAFVGSQMHFEIGERDFFIDLLFYHLRLRCFVVIELKAVEFEPEFAGKMNFYLSAVDDLMRHQDDKPSIGIILCKTKNKVIAEYALRYLDRPIGVSAFQLTDSLPDNLKGNLPSIDEIEKELSDHSTTE